ncbi:MAG: type II secretion system F family protein [Armatimonadota bacterium]|nr:type II secretion system F family protein [Armatimonadota bacterium]MCX7778060.1 type II secretion system F family protein [Armatimonadota bacterium]MDW8026056.1 type II secretion system F family protein [Armatimonadota bacterium]
MAATRSRSLNRRQLAMLCRQFSALCSAGVDMLRILKVLRQQAEDERLVEILLSVERDLRMGKSLAAGFARFPTVFSPMFISMVRQGEREGILDEIMLRLAEHLEREAELELPFPNVSRVRQDGELTFERLRPLVVWLTIICGVISVAIAGLWYVSIIGLLPSRYLGPNMSLLVGVLSLSFALVFLRYKPPKVARCSFCGGTEIQVGPLIPGEGVWICEGCIAKSAQMMKEHRLAELEARGEPVEPEPEEGEEMLTLEEGERPQGRAVDVDDEEV